MQGLHWDPPTISAEQSFSACTAGARLGQTPHASALQDSDRSAFSRGLEGNPWSGLGIHSVLVDTDPKDPRISRHFGVSPGYHGEHVISRCTSVVDNPMVMAT